MLRGARVPRPSLLYACATRAEHVTARRRTAKGALFGGCCPGRERRWAPVGCCSPLGRRAEAVVAMPGVFFGFVLFCPFLDSGCRGGWPWEARGEAAAGADGRCWA